MDRNGVVIVGGGLAGQRCAERLRRQGYDGPVRMVCAEPDPPYDRPPLSKQVLAGTADAGSLSYKPPWWYEEAQVEVLLGVRAVGLDPRRRRLAIDGGPPLVYDKLLIACGVAARRLRFLEGFGNVHYLRTRADAERLRAGLRAGARLAIVGAGFIGQEVAATARGLGVEVTMIEALPAPLANILGERLGAWFARLHGEEGVRLHAGSAIAGARGAGMVEELLLEGGGRVPCDEVVVGVGTVSATDWLAGSGLDAAGLRADVGGRTELRDVFAAGDACLPFDPRLGEHVRTEHWDAAAWQGAAVARAMLGEEPGTPPLPSFWSDQYGMRVQCVGHPRGADGVQLEGDPAARDFQALLTRAGKPVAGLTVGRPRAIPELRRQIERGLASAPDHEKEEVAA
jgi:NADPH-dependent 2,4-dienoyl-CoA reductase/sulfur reductase-like enzyme